MDYKGILYAVKDKLEEDDSLDLIFDYVSDALENSPGVSPFRASYSPKGFHAIVEDGTILTLTNCHTLPDAMEELTRRFPDEKLKAIRTRI